MVRHIRYLAKKWKTRFTKYCADISMETIFMNTETVKQMNHINLLKNIRLDLLPRLDLKG